MSKKPYVCHAEMNAIMNKNQAGLVGCCIYVTLFPCNECAKLIIQSGICEIVYLAKKHEDRWDFKASSYLLAAAKIACRKFDLHGSPERIILNFTTADDHASARVVHQK